MIGDGKLPEKEVVSGEGANVVRGEVIRFFAYGGNEKNPILGAIIHLHGAWISEGLDLAHVSIHYALMLSNCHFGASVIMLHMECPALYLNGSRLVQGLNADGLTTKGNVNLRDDFSAEGEVRLLGASIGGDLSCVGGKFHNSDGNALHADGLTTGGNVALRDGFSAEGEVRLLSADIGRNLSCTGGKFNNPDGRALSVDGLTAQGSVNLRDNFSAEGEVRLLGADIGGNLDCKGGKFNNAGGAALSADRLTTKGNVALRDGFSAEGEVRLLGASIGGDLSCVGGKFHNVGGNAISADKLTTKGSVNLAGGFSAEGEVRLLNANIGGNLVCVDGKFNNSDGYALFADGLTTKGNVFLRNSFFAEGEVRLLGANIGMNLDCADGKFHNPGGYALVADRLKAQGSVYLRGGFSAEGEVRLLSAIVDGNLDCTGGEFQNSGQYALSVDKLATKGSVNLSSGFFAKGAVRLLSANINGDLDCENGIFQNPGGYALNIRQSNIRGSLLWHETTCEGDVNLAYAKAEVLTDVLEPWESGEIVLDGFTYNRFAYHRDIKYRLCWLAKRPERMEFSPLPYEQAAKVLFGMGYIRDAREILLEKERLLTKDGEMHWLRIVGRQLWDMFAGYGYRLRYTMAWMLGFIALGAVFFDFAASHNQIVPHQSAILASEKYQAALTFKEYTPMEAARASFPDEYPEFTPLAFSLDVFMPFFALHQEPSWSPASDREDDLRKSSILLALLLAALTALLASAWLAQECHKRIRRERGNVSEIIGAGIGMAFLVLMLGIISAVGGAHIFWDFEIMWLMDSRWLTVWYWVEIGAGWMLSSLFLLSVTSILRPRQSPGEKD